MKRFSPLSVLILAVLCILGSLASPAAAMPGYRGTFDQDEACKGQDGIVLKSDADAGTMPNGYFVYSGGLIFCCSGRAFDVMCSEMMEGYCECAEDIKATNEDELLQTTDKEYTEIVKTCYAQKCTSQIKATPIKDGVPVKSGPAAMCWMPEDVTLQARGFTNNVTVMAQDFCAAYAPLRVPPKSVPTKNPEKTGTFELLKNEQTGISSTGIVPVHLAMIPRTEKVVMWSRGQQPNAPVQTGTEFSVSVVYDWKSGMYETVDVDSNPFCSSVGFSKNGNVLAFGGDQASAPWGEQWSPLQVVEGRDKIREFDVETFEWKTVGSLGSNHWYPTNTLLEDGRVLNQGGFESMVGPQNEAFEIWNSDKNELEKVYNSTKFAQTMSIMNLYPFFSYLPYTDPSNPDDIFLLMDLCNHAEMYTIGKDNTLTVSSDSNDKTAPDRGLIIGHPTHAVPICLLNFFLTTAKGGSTTNGRRR